MGLFIYISEWDRKFMRKVNDPDLQEILDEALTADKSLMIVEHNYTVKKFLKKPETHTEYSIYHEQFDGNGKPVYQARSQMSASGSIAVVIAYFLA